ncbi:hypothetical protein J717_1254 [Acinetobacter baumannii 121738]|nr:hypothetical protein J717_1254 [Acinetobacter baumannii 121738]
MAFSPRVPHRVDDLEIKCSTTSVANGVAHRTDDLEISTH